MVAARENQAADAGSARNLTFWDGVSAQSLACSLRQPTLDCVDQNAHGRRTIRLSTRNDRRRLRLVVTAISAYRHPIAKIFAEALGERLSLTQDLYERVYTALQEALMNAMLHGNLGLDSGLRENLRDLAKWHALIEERFALPYVARSLIRLNANWTGAMLRIAIRDSGEGFTRSPSSEALLKRSEAPIGSGRGLAILDALCDRTALRRGGTVIELDFFLVDRA